MTRNDSKTLPAYQVLADALRARILSGELQPGTRLPTEPDLRAECGVGRSTIREAMRSLASQNLITTTRGVTGGSFVSSPSMGHISAHLETGVALMAAAETVSVDQLMEVRNLMEVPAAGIAAHRRNDVHLRELGDVMFEPDGTQGPDTYSKTHEHVRGCARDGTFIQGEWIHPFWNIRRRYSGLNDCIARSVPKAAN
ncbi:FadR/GntR family transcriptional regulator [Rhodococcus jostii]|uniref:FadR/GntR family transcriptional regulator n=1 Tax=Rhodococcus jostii TaxID=132919 RepID=UPI0036615DBE